MDEIDLDGLNELKHDRNFRAVRVAKAACELLTAKAHLTTPPERLKDLEAQLEEAANAYIKVSDRLRDALDEFAND